MNPIFEKLCPIVLTADGHSVISVSNATDAVTEIKDGFFDLVFLDLNLGTDDGMDLIPVLSGDSPWTKIVVITAHASIESAGRSYAPWCDPIMLPNPLHPLR